MDTRTNRPTAAFVFALLVLSAPAAAEGASAAPDAGAAARERGVVLVGLLTKQARKQCVADDPRPRWVHPWWEVGYTRVAPVDGVALASLEGRLVVAEGRPETLPPVPPAESTGPCTVPQLRSDWEETPNGTRIRRGPGSGLPGFRATAVRPFEELAVRATGGADSDATSSGGAGGGELEVRVTNPFPEPLPPLVVTLHYEGCYGKPGTTARQAELPALAPGASAAVRFPAFDVTPDRPARRSDHRAAAVQVAARAAGAASPVVFDLAVPLSHFPDVDVDCPRD